jgi:hypothetical protein
VTTYIPRPYLTECHRGLSRRIEACTKDLKGTRESSRLVGDAKNPMFQDMYDGQNIAGMVAARAARESQCELERTSSFQLVIKSVSIVSPPVQNAAPRFMRCPSSGGWAYWIVPTPEDIFRSRPCKKQSSTDNIVRGVALMINL